jgi:MFS family permease
MIRNAFSLSPNARILVITVLNGVAITAIRPMVSYRALELGADALGLGIVASSYSALSLFAAFVIGRWIDRYGASRFLVGGACLMALSAFSSIWLGSIIGLALAQSVLGLGQVMNRVASQTIIANQSRRDQRDERFGLYAVADSAGDLIGPLLAGFVAGSTLFVTAGGRFNSVVPIVMAGVIAVFAAAFGAFGGPDFGPRPRKPARMVRTHRAAAISILRVADMPQAILASVSVLLSINLLVAYLPAFGEQEGLAVEFVGILLALRAAGSMASRLFMGRLIRRFGRGPLLVTSMSTAAASIAFVPFLPHPIPLVALMVLMGIGLGFGQPMTMAWIANRVPRDERAAALSVRITGNRIGQVVLPVVMGVIAGAAGLTTMFVALAGFLAGGAFVVRRTTHLDDASELPATPAAEDGSSGIELAPTIPAKSGGNED